MLFFKKIVLKINIYHPYIYGMYKMDHSSIYWILLHDHLHTFIWLNIESFSCGYKWFFFFVNIYLLKKHCSPNLTAYPIYLIFFLIET